MPVRCAIFLCLVAVASSALGAPGGHAGARCTLTKGVRVSQGGAWRVIPRGTAVVVTGRDGGWATIVVDGQPARASTTFIEQACDLPPPEAAAPPPPPPRPKAPRATPPPPKVPKAPVNPATTTTPTTTTPATQTTKLAAPLTGSPLVVLLPLAGDARTNDGLRAAVASVPDVRVLDKATTADTLVSGKALGISCTGKQDGACLSRIGALAGGALVVAGTARKDRGGLLLSLRLVDVATGQERAQATSVVPLDPPPQERALRLLAVRLLAPQREVGLLALHVAQTGAAVLVDGQPASAGELPLSPGRHEVYVALTGYESTTQAIDVAFDQTVRLDVNLVAEAGAPAPAAVVAPAVAKAAAADNNTLLVMDLDGLGVTPDTVRIVNDLLPVRFAACEGLQVLSARDVRTMLSVESERQHVGCSADSCLAEIAGAVGSRYVAHGSVGKIGSEIVVTVGVFDSTTAKSIGAESQRVASESRVADAIDALVGAMAPKLGAKPPPAQTVLADHAVNGSEVDPFPLGLALSGTGVGVGVVGVAGFGTVALLQSFVAGDLERDRTSRLTALQAGQWMLVGAGASVVVGSAAGAALWLSLSD